MNFTLNQGKKLLQTFDGFMEKLFYLKTTPEFTTLEFSHLWKVKFHQKHKISVILNHQWKSVNFMLNQSGEIFQKLALRKFSTWKTDQGSQNWSSVTYEKWYIFHQKHIIPVNVDHQLESVNCTLNQKPVFFLQKFSYQKKRPNFVALGVQSPVEGDISS